MASPRATGKIHDCDIEASEASGSIVSIFTTNTSRSVDTAVSLPTVKRSSERRIESTFDAKEDEDEIMVFDKRQKDVTKPDSDNDSDNDSDGQSTDTVLDPEKYTQYLDDCRKIEDQTEIEELIDEPPYHLIVEPTDELLNDPVDHLIVDQVSVVKVNYLTLNNQTEDPVSVFKVDYLEKCLTIQMNKACQIPIDMLENNFKLFVTKYFR